MKTESLLRTAFTPLYEKDVQEWEEVMGYLMPTAVAGLETEYHALRNAVVGQDYSMLYKWFVEGPDARKAADRLFSRDVHSLDVGRIAYGVIVAEDGGMVDDVTVTVLDAETVLIQGGNPSVLDALRAAAPAGTTVGERRNLLAVLAVQGPNSRELLQRLTDVDLGNAAFPYYSVLTDVKLAGVPATVFRLGFTAELGYEVMVGAEDAAALYEAVFAQTDLGITPFAGGTLMVARIEAGLMLADVDYNEDITPFECRLGWTVDLEKAPFRGQNALRERKGNAPLRVVSVVSDVPAQSLDGAALFANGREIGTVTMAVSSPALDGTTLGLARIAKEFAPIGTRLSAYTDGDEVGVEVRSTPVYDPERLRVRS